MTNRILKSQDINKITKFSKLQHRDYPQYTLITDGNPENSKILDPEGNELIGVTKVVLTIIPDQPSELTLTVNNPLVIMNEET